MNKIEKIDKALMLLYPLLFFLLMAAIGSGHRGIATLALVLLIVDTLLLLVTLGWSYTRRRQKNRRNSQGVFFKQRTVIPDDNARLLADTTAEESGKGNVDPYAEPAFCSRHRTYFQKGQMCWECKQEHAVTEKNNTEESEVRTTADPVDHLHHQVIQDQKEEQRPEIKDRHQLLRNALITAAVLIGAIILAFLLSRW